MTDTMTNEQIDVAAAVDVMGWSVRHAFAPPAPTPEFEMFDVGIVVWRCAEQLVPEAWSPSTNPAHDYEVLVYVREHWGGEDTCLVREALTLSWERRWAERGGKLACGSIMYEPGDYARAAIAAQGDTP